MQSQHDVMRPTCCDETKLSKMMPSFSLIRCLVWIEVILLCSLVISDRFVSVGGLEISVSNQRRRFLASSASGCVSTLLWSSIANDGSALADPYNALLPVGSGGNLMGLVSEKTPGWSPPALVTKLGTSRIGTSSLSPLQQQPFAVQELYYPSFFFGEWDVKATLRQKQFPFGYDFLPSRSFREGSPRNRMEQVGDTTSYLVHYFSTLADTARNQVTVNLGLGVPEPKVIADRAYNVISMSRAYGQVSPVETVEWDYRKDATRLTLQFASVTDDMRPVGQRRAEVYLTARQTEDAYDELSGRPVFAAAERSRSVTVGPGSVSANDQEVITEYRQVDDDLICAISRVSVYLTPNPNSREGVLWQQVQGKAVALYDYEFEMKRQKEEFTVDVGTDAEARVLRPCVTTPKDVVQCQ